MTEHCKARHGPPEKVNFRDVPILPFRLSGAMKLLWYDFEGRKFPLNIRVAYVLIISHQFPSLT